MGEIIHLKILLVIALHLSHNNCNILLHQICLEIVVRLVNKNEIKDKSNENELELLI